MEINFAVFILTNRSVQQNYTYRTLRRSGYTGDIYIISGDECEYLDDYKREYKEKVLVFNKEDIATRFDTADNDGDLRAVVYARNACFELAKEIGIKYFLVLDDDYSNFYGIGNLLAVNFKQSLRKKIKNLDRVFDLMFNYYKNIPALSIAMAQTGDFVGGSLGLMHSVVRRRKCMNSFFCSTDRPFTFLGKINEDVNAYLRLGNIGYIFLTIPIVFLQQIETQKNKGGLTDIYLDKGTYIKSFYSVMYQPSSVKVALMSSKYRRLHHKVNWKNTVPMIIGEEYKKYE